MIATFTPNAAYSICTPTTATVCIGKIGSPQPFKAAFATKKDHWAELVTK